MDGSVSTQNSHVGFIVGLSAAIGAGISMAFAEGLSDDGVLTGRGHLAIRGGVAGLMTAIGGLLHPRPFLVANLLVALYRASIVVGGELVAIADIRYHFFTTNFWHSAPR